MRFEENVILKSQLNLKIRSPRVIRKAINKPKTLLQLVPQLISSLKICKTAVFPLPAITVGKLLTEVGGNSTENIGCCTSPQGPFQNSDQEASSFYFYHSFTLPGN